MRESLLARLLLAATVGAACGGKSEIPEPEVRDDVTAGNQGSAGTSLAGSGGVQNGGGFAGTGAGGVLQGGFGGTGQAGTGQAGSGISGQAGTGQAGTGQAGTGQAGTGQGGSGQAGFGGASPEGCQSGGACVKDAWCKPQYDIPACHCASSNGYLCDQQPQQFASLLICFDIPSAGCPALNTAELYPLIDAEYKASCPYIASGPQLLQDSSGAPHCCYQVETDACVGRPLRVDGRRTESVLVRTDAWS